MIEQLEELAANDQEKWLNLDIEEQELFEQNFAQWVDENTTAFESYLLQQDPLLLGTMSIAFECISNSGEHLNLLLPVVRKVLHFPFNEDTIDFYNLDVLDDISTYDLYLCDKTVYLNYIDLLISKLRLDQHPEYLRALFGVVQFAIVKPESIQEKQYLKRDWIDAITLIANSAELELKLEAQNLLKELGFTENIQALSIVERIRKFLRLT